MKKKRKKETKYLSACVSWIGKSSFEILDNKTFETITGRVLRQNGKQCWFNITNVKNEVNAYAERLGLKSDLGELFICIDREGFSYHDREKAEQKLADTNRTNLIVLID